MKKFYVIQAGPISMYIEADMITFCKRLKVGDSEVPFTRSMPKEKCLGLMEFYSHLITYDIHKRLFQLNSVIKYRRFRIRYSNDTSLPVVDLDGFLVDGDVFLQLTAMYKDIRK